MKRWIVGLVTLFVAGAAQAYCPSSWSDECSDWGSTCYEAIQACEDAEQELRSKKDKLETLRRQIRKCIRSGDFESRYCLRAKRG